MTTISVSEFGWQYATRTTAVLENISFDISSGERVLILGASGSGKSTLLKAIAGVLGDDEGTHTGEVLIDGVATRSLRGKTGLVLQDPSSNIILERVGDEVAFGMENLGVLQEVIWPWVGTALEQVGLDIELSHSTAQLSGGQQQRLALASVLAMKPAVLCLDEPTSNLDPEGVQQLTQTLRDVMKTRDTPVVIVEHRVDAWWDFATRIIALGSSGVLWDGEPHKLPREVATELELRGVWLPQSLRSPNNYPAATNLKGQELLTTSGVRAGYPADSPTPLIADETFSSGAIYAITGPNGAGKSSFALTLAGIIATCAGEVHACEELAAGAATSPVKWKSSQLLSRIGFVFQSPENQFVARTVREELEVGPRALRLPQEEIQSRVNALLDTLHLRELADAHPFTLSGGQQRRLSVATVLATTPRVIICDEPTFGQDANTWKELVDLLRALRDAGHCIIVVTHDQEFVDALADHVIVLGGGDAEN